MSSLWDRVRELPLRVDGYRLAPRELVTNSGYGRRTTEMCLRGLGQEGRGEDVLWDGELQGALQSRGAYLDLAGEFTLESFCARLEELELSPDPPPISDWLHYRRWAFESAALDLALRQNELSLERALERDAQPLTFVVSLGPHSMEDLEARLRIHPGLHFKLDATPDWSPAFCAQLAATQAVEVVDFKGAYKGTSVDVQADPDLYRRVLDAMPSVVCEDPHDRQDIFALLRERRAQVAWDAPIHGIQDLSDMGAPADALNIKPSRFGSLARLSEAYAHCETVGLPMYGGGQFELAHGREQIQRLAAIFHPHGANDVAPRGYHQLDLDEARPASPLPTGPCNPGF